MIYFKAMASFFGPMVANTGAFGRRGYKKVKDTARKAQTKSSRVRGRKEF